MCWYLLGKTKEIYSGCQALLLGCIFLLLRSPESCVTVLVDIQMQTLKHSVRKKKENNWIANAPDSGVDLFCCLLYRKKERSLANIGINCWDKNEFRAKPNCSDGGKNSKLNEIYAVGLHPVYSRCFSHQITSASNSCASYFRNFVFFFSPSLSWDDWNTCRLNRCDDIPGKKKLPSEEPKHPK